MGNIANWASRAVVKAAATLSLLATASAQRVGAPTDDLTKLGVDELFSVQVTSVGRKAQQISKSPGFGFRADG